MELPGFVSIYLKHHHKDLSGTVLYSQAAFASPTDGKTVKKTPLTEPGIAFADKSKKRF